MAENNEKPDWNRSCRGKKKREGIYSRKVCDQSHEKEKKNGGERNGNRKKKMKTKWM